jgi:hypothetical protein
MQRSLLYAAESITLEQFFFRLRLSDPLLNIDIGLHCNNMYEDVVLIYCVTTHLPDTVSAIE